MRHHYLVSARHRFFEKIYKLLMAESNYMVVA